MSLTLMVIIRYICKFNRQLNVNEKFRITNLARNAAAYTKGQTPSDNIYQTVCRLKMRVRVFACVTAIYIVCWYPLIVLTMMDYKYERARYLYRILTVLAWSHSTLVPLTYLLIDGSFSIITQFRQTLTAHRVRGEGSPSQQRLMSTVSSANSMHLNHHQSLHNHTNYTLSTINSHEPALAAKNHTLPTINHTLPTNNRALPANNYALPIQNHTLPSDNKVYTRNRDHAHTTKSTYSNQNHRSYDKHASAEKLSDFEEDVDMPVMAPAELNRLLPDQKYEDNAV